jgi:serine/threonine protein kinase
MIGRGGFGSVYRATDHEHGREVAIKVLSGTLGEKERRRFDRERQTMGRLGSHPNIIPVHESGYTEDGEGYLVMELAPGGSLRDWLEANQTLPWENAVSVMASIADAIQAAHDQGVLHRDIKPDNILIDAYDNPRLTDFGIAAVASNATATTSMSATLAHAAPEVLQGMTNTEAVDIYAIGSTLHNLITGSAPFERADDVGVTAMMARALSEPPPDLTSYGVPPAVAQVVQRALAKEPTDRPATAAQLAAELRAAATGSQAPGAGAIPPLGQPTQVGLDPGQTMVAQPSGTQPPGAQPSATQPPGIQPSATYGAGPGDITNVIAGVPTGPSPGPHPTYQPAPFEPGRPQSRSRAPLLAAAILVIALLGAGAALAASGALGGDDKTTAIGETNGGDDTTPSTEESTGSTSPTTESGTEESTTPTTEAPSDTTETTMSTTSPTSTTSTTVAPSCQTVVQTRTSRFDIEVCAFPSGALRYIGMSQTNDNELRVDACLLSPGVFLAVNEQHEYYVDLPAGKLRVYDPEGALIIDQDLLAPTSSDLSGPLQPC